MSRSSIQPYKSRARSTYTREAKATRLSQHSDFSVAVRNWAGARRIFKTSHHDHNPIFHRFFRTGAHCSGSRSHDRTGRLHDFVKQVGLRFQLDFSRRIFWSDILAAITIPNRSRSRPGTADVFATRWISGCVLLATTCSIVAASAAHNQALLFRLRPTLLSRCWFLLRLRREWRSSDLAAECART